MRGSASRIHNMQNAAGRTAHITQPAFSKSIRTLEKPIDIQLFDRSERPQNGSG
jgi:DNA-binding transcriptional LysR family regulator